MNSDGGWATIDVSGVSCTVSYYRQGVTTPDKTWTFTKGGGDTEKPPIPTNLTATAASATQVNLAWTASTDNVGVTGYKIYRNGGASPIGTSPTNSYSDTSVSPSTTYTYEVSAYDAATNESDKSSAIGVTTPCGSLPSDKGVVTQ